MCSILLLERMNMLIKLVLSFQAGTKKTFGFGNWMLRMRENLPKEWAQDGKNVPASHHAL